MELSKMNTATSDNSTWQQPPSPGLAMVYVDHALDGTVPSKDHMAEAENDLSHAVAAVPSVDKTQSGIPSIANNGAGAEQASQGHNINETPAAVHNDEKAVKVTGADSSNAASPSHTTKSAARRRILFTLPCEVRLMIWQQCIPGPRELVARPRYGSRTGNEASRWIFRVKRTSSPPVLQICNESRASALRIGGFAFKGTLAADTGLWWNPTQDTLLLDVNWSPHQSLWSLRGLKGLEYVEHMAINWALARWYVSYQKGRANYGTPLESVVAYRFSLHSPPPIRHPVAEFFKHIKSFSVQFRREMHEMRLEDTDDEESNIENINQGDPKDHSVVTFHLGCDTKTAYLELIKYAELCKQLVKWCTPHEFCIEQVFRGDDGMVFLITLAMSEGNVEAEIKWGMHVSASPFFFLLSPMF